MRRFVACMIRLGDLLDISDNRFNLYTIHQIKELPDISSTHKQKHECIEKLNICKEIITATFNCPNDAVYREVAKWCEMLCEELKEQRLHWNDIVPEELSRISFFPPYTKKGNDGIKILFQRKSDINPALMNLQFNISSQKTFEMLKGEAIYDIVNQSMPDMLNPKLTASWEKGLDMVAKKEIEPEVFMEKLENYIQSKFDKLVVKY